jgi:hypothetical protein
MIGSLFTLGSDLKIAEVAHIHNWAIFGPLFSPRKQLCINFDKKMVVHFGRLFHKLIWSP